VDAPARIVRQNAVLSVSRRSRNQGSPNPGGGRCCNRTKSQKSSL
jgi:hypothetical protein